MKLETTSSVYMDPSKDRDVLQPSSSSPQSEVKCKVEEQSTDDLASAISLPVLNFTPEMSHHMNPFTQGGWSRAGNGHSNGVSPWDNTADSPPSIFGALPTMSTTAPRAMQPDSVTYRFTGFNTTVLNCSVLGPQERVAYRVVTDSTAPSCTIFKDNESRNIAMVQWQPNATLEIRGVTPRRKVREWLRLSSDRTRRYMEVGGVQYAWAPIDGFICLYKVQSSAPRVLARVARAPNMVLLELTQEAIQTYLLEPCLVATVMLVCGHNIE